LGSWHETAAVLNTLDAVVTVDTGIAHMAGTLGVPVFMLMPVITDWRWGMGTETTPWYKSVRIFRQKNLGDWSPVMEQARLALEGLHAESR
jgi:ADP-heptose:LPS heptosyltransferase